MRVGFVGLGRMGSRMAANVAAGGFPLVLYNRTREKAERVAATTGGDVVDTPGRLAAEADVIVTMLADGAALEAVYEGGILEALGPGKVCVDMGTVGPEVVTRLGARIDATGATLVDAPVSGSTASVEARSVMIMAGGPEAAVERVRPVLASIGNPVLHVGSRGAGATLKLAINAIIYGINQSVAESLVMAERAGVDRGVAYNAFVNSAVAAPVVKYRQPVFEHPGELPVTFTLDLALKDLDLILALGEATGARLPQAVLNRSVMQEASAAGLGDSDMGDVAVHLRRLAEAAGTGEG